MGLFRIAIGVLALAGLAWAGAEEAARLYYQGKKAEKKGRVVDAYLLYSQAAAADPGSSKYWLKSQALRTRAAMDAHTMPPVDVGPPASAGAESSPQPPDPEPAARELEQAREPQPPTELAARPGTQAIDFKGDSKALWEKVATLYGLEAVFDGDYQPSPPVRFHIGEATYSEALHALETATGSFIVPISPKLFMVVKDTQQKRTEVENTVAFTIPIPEPVSIQDAQELARGVQQLMELPKFAIDSGQRLVLVRGPVSKVEPARILFHELLLHRPQIYLEVEILSVSRSSTISFGIPLTASYVLSAPLNVTNLFKWAGGLGAIRVAITGTQMLLQGSKSDVKSLLRTEARSVDGQPVNVHIGDKYPLVTTTFAGGGDSSQTLTLPPVFQFEDLGLTLKVTPKVHGDSELTLDIEAEYKTLGTGSLNGIPVISTRKFINRARLRFGEAAVIAGLISADEARDMAGFAGLGDVPLVGPLTALNSWKKNSGQTLLVIRPQLIDTPAYDVSAHSIWTGTESRPKSPI